MMDEIDIYRSAKQVLDQYGDGAIQHARDRAEALRQAGDQEEAFVWRRIDASLTL